MDHFTFIVQHWDTLQRLCKRMSRGRRDLVDDLWDACVLERVQDILKTYNPSHGASQLTHVYRSLTWYMWKWMNKRAKQTLASIHDEDVYHDKDLLNLEDAEEVQYLMSGLCQYDRDILTMREVDEMTFAEMGAVIGKCKCTARNHYHKALRRVQDAQAHD